MEKRRQTTARPSPSTLMARRRRSPRRLPSPRRRNLRKKLPLLPSQPPHLSQLQHQSQHPPPLPRRSESQLQQQYKLTVSEVGGCHATHELITYVVQNLSLLNVILSPL